MTITAIKSSSEFDRSTLADFAELILAGMSDLCGLDLITNTSVIFAREGKYRARSYLERDLNSAIAGGKSVIAIISDQDDLPDSARYLPRCSLSFSPITGDIIAEVMRVTWKTPSRRLTAMLRQQDPKIASLPYCVILGVLEQIEPGRNVETVIKALERGAQPPVGPSLNDLYLPNSLQEHMDAVLTDIADFRAGVVAWPDVSVSTLLFAPPGNGKTSLARALAGSGHLHYVSCSFSDCQANGSLSDFLKALQKRCAEARSC